jgi:hypothetical protein
MIAAKSNSYRFVRFFLKQKNVSLSYRNKDEQTVMDLAKDSRIKKLLIDNVSHFFLDSLSSLSFLIDTLLAVHIELLQ